MPMFIGEWQLDNFYIYPTKMDRALTDCYFYYYSQCRKGTHCGFRHEPAALGHEVMCSRWLEGRCYDVKCKDRHMRIGKKRGQIQCFWESTPNGCTKPHCVFRHQKPHVSDVVVQPQQQQLQPQQQQTILIDPTIQLIAAAAAGQPAVIENSHQQQQQMLQQHHNNLIAAAVQQQQQQLQLINQNAAAIVAATAPPSANFSIITTPADTSGIQTLCNDNDCGGGGDLTKTSIIE